MGRGQIAVDARVPAAGRSVGMTLSRYIARRFASAFLLVFLIFFGLMMLVDLVEQIGRFPTSVSFGQRIGLAALKVPESLYRILPLVTILAAAAFFLALARSSELVVIRAAGRSGLRLLLTPVCVALLIGAIAVMVLNPIIAGTIKRHDELASRYVSGSSSVLSISPEGLWLRQGGEGQQTVIRANRANQDGTVLDTVTFIEFAPTGRPVARIEAERATLGAGEWQLAGVKRWQLDSPNPEATAVTEAEAFVRSDLTRDRIRDSFGEPYAVAIWDLPAFIASLDAAGFSARRHKVWFQMELAQPILLAGMVLLAAGFTMRPARFARTGMTILATVLSGFAIFFLRNFAQVLGETGQIPVLIAAWFPPVATLFLSLGLLLHMEDG
jgi:lipopolysaccharide export system permease protein